MCNRNELTIQLLDIGEFAQNFSTAGNLPELFVIDDGSWSVAFDAMVVDDNIISRLPNARYVNRLLSVRPFI